MKAALSRQIQIEGLLDLLQCQSRDRRIQFICDARALHRHLFSHGRGLTRGVPGQYRKSSDPDRGSVCVLTRTRGLHLQSDGLAADLVGSAMRNFRDQMRAVLTLPPPKDAVPTALTHLLAEFVLIHPFSDGNGRTARLMLLAAARHLVCPMTPEWTVSPRPHGAGFSVALLAYKRSPEPFVAYMRRFFAPEVPK